MTPVDPFTDKYSNTTLAPIWALDKVENLLKLFPDGEYLCDLLWCSGDVELLDFREVIEECRYLSKRKCGSRVEAEEKVEYQIATRALKERLDPGNQALAALDFGYTYHNDQVNMCQNL